MRTVWGDAARGVALALLAISFDGMAIAQETEPNSTDGPLSGLYGRSYVLDLPVYLGDFFLGEAPVEIVGDTPKAISGADILRLLSEVVTEPTMDGLRAAASEGGMTPIAALEEAGLGFRFDQENISIVVDLGLDAQQVVRLRADRYSYTFTPTHEPANVSAFLNLRGSQIYDHDKGEFEPLIVGLEGAMRFGGLVLEAEGYADSEIGLVREGSRAVIDHEPLGLRAQGGDVRIATTGFQNGADLLGASVSRNIELRPFQSTIRATGRRSFDLTRQSEVEIFANGALARRLMLEPGRYEVDDFLTTLGRNDVRIEIIDRDGRREEIEFTLFSDTQVLGVGEIELAAATGLRSERTLNDRDYDFDAPVFSGFARMGVTDQLTAGINLQADDQAKMVGAEARIATGVAVFGADIAASLDDQESAGFAVSLRASRNSFAFGADGDRDRNLSLSLRYYSEDFATIGGSKPGATLAAEFDASYTQELAYDATLGLTGSYRLGRAGAEDRYGFQTQLSKYFTAGPVVQIGAGYETGESGDGELYGFLGLTFRFSGEDSFSADYDTRGGRGTASYRHIEGDHVGAINATALTTSSDDGSSIFAGADYTANRFVIGASHDLGFEGRYESMTGNRTTLRAATAIVFADNRLALTRPVAGSFAIIGADASLAESEISITRGNDDVLARSDALGPAVVHNVSPYTNRSIRYDVDPLPVGYDLGEGGVRLVAPYAAGYSVTVGSAYNITTLGVLLDDKGTPLSLRTGVMTLAGDPDAPAAAFFTNRNGRFVAQGLKPGSWTISVTGIEGTATVDLSEGGGNFIRAGDIQLGNSGEQP